MIWLLICSYFFVQNVSSLDEERQRRFVEKYNELFIFISLLRQPEIQFNKELGELYSHRFDSMSIFHTSELICLIYNPNPAEVLQLG